MIVMPVKICKGSAWQVMFPVVPSCARSSVLSHHQTSDQGRKWWRNMSPIPAWPRYWHSDDMMIISTGGRNPAPQFWAQPSRLVRRQQRNSAVSGWKQDDDDQIWLLWPLAGDGEALDTLISHKVCSSRSLSYSLIFEYLLTIFQTPYCLVFNRVTPDSSL